MVGVGGSRGPGAKPRSGRQLKRHPWIEERAPPDSHCHRDQHSNPLPASHSNGRKDLLRLLLLPRRIISSSLIRCRMYPFNSLPCSPSRPPRLLQLEIFPGHQSVTCYWSSEPGSKGGSGPPRASRPLPGNELEVLRRSPWWSISTERPSHRAPRPFKGRLPMDAQVLHQAHAGQLDWTAITGQLSELRQPSIAPFSIYRTDLANPISPIIVVNGPPIDVDSSTRISP